jgi:hypothetical protein
MNHLESPLWPEMRPWVVKDGRKVELKLRNVQIIHRHGDRTPVSVFGGEENDLEKWRKILEDSHEFQEFCKAFEENRDEKHKVFCWDVLMRSAELEKLEIRHAYENGQQHNAEQDLMYDHWYKDLSLGQLTPKGKKELQELGKKLRDVYCKELGLLSGYDKNEVCVYSTNYRRTILSVSNLLRELFPLEQRTESIPIHIRSPLHTEIVFPPKSWSAVNQKKRPYPDWIARDLAMDSIKLKFQDQFNVENISWPHLADLVTVNVSHNQALPDWIDDHTIGQILRHSIAKWDTEFNTLQSLRFAAGRLVEILVHRSVLPKVLPEGHHPKMFIYSAHDNTLYFLLKALGCDMSMEWPPYASYFIIESYMDPDQNLYNRIIYNGEVIDPEDHYKNLPVSRVNREHLVLESSPGILSSKKFRGFLEKFIPEDYELEYPGIRKWE